MELLPAWIRKGSIYLLLQKHFLLPTPLGVFPFWTTLRVDLVLAWSGYGLFYCLLYLEVFIKITKPQARILTSYHSTTLIESSSSYLIFNFPTSSISKFGTSMWINYNQLRINSSLALSPLGIIPTTVEILYSMQNKFLLNPKTKSVIMILRSDTKHLRLLLY